MYKVITWNGAGYQTHVSIIDEECVEKALEMAVASSLVLGLGKVLFINYDEFDDYDAVDQGEIDNYMYMDLTSHGLGTGYLLIENLQIIEMNEDEKFVERLKRLVSGVEQRWESRSGYLEIEYELDEKDVDVLKKALLLLEGNK